MSKQPEALRLAEILDLLWLDGQTPKKAAAELRRLHDLLGKANALCRIREERIKELEAENDALRAELEIETHRLAACSVAALGYFDGCADEYKSASLDDVLRLHAENEALRADAERLDWCIDILFVSRPDFSYLVTDVGCGCCADDKDFAAGTTGRAAIDAARGEK